MTRIQALLNWMRGLWYYITQKKMSDLQCPWCGDYHYGELAKVKVTDSGFLSTPNGIIFWHEGEAQCGACGHWFEYGDSSG